MLHQSIEAHRRAAELHPATITSVAHTFFLAGEYASAIETYSGRAAYYLDAAAWAPWAIENERSPSCANGCCATAEQDVLIQAMIALMSSLSALLEGRADDAVLLMQTADTTREPEILVYFARHYARLKLPDLAVTALKQAAQSGFRLRTRNSKVRPLANRDAQTSRVQLPVEHRGSAGRGSTKLRGMHGITW
jgi:hypothetical protein